MLRLGRRLGLVRRALVAAVHVLEILDSPSCPRCRRRPGFATASRARSAFDRRGCMSRMRAIDSCSTRRFSSAMNRESAAGHVRVVALLPHGERVVGARRNRVGVGLASSGVTGTGLACLPPAGAFPAAPAAVASSLASASARAWAARPPSAAARDVALAERRQLELDGAVRVLPGARSSSSDELAEHLVDRKVDAAAGRQGDDENRDALAAKNARALRIVHSLSHDPEVVSPAVMAVIRDGAQRRAVALELRKLGDQQQRVRARAGHAQLA